MSDSRTLWRRWVLAFTLGELIGFGGIPALGAFVALSLTAQLDGATQAVILYVVAVIGGLGEGAVLAWFQLRVLRRRLPRLEPRRWIFATAIAAAFAWACGMLAPTLDALVGLTLAAQAAIWIPSGVLILASIGIAQACALRGVVERPQRWLVANVAGWAAGLPWTFVLPALVPESAPWPIWLVAFIVAGVLMGATAGAITGAFVVRLKALADDPPPGVHA